MCTHGPNEFANNVAKAMSHSIHWPSLVYSIIFCNGLKFMQMLKFMPSVCVCVRVLQYSKCSCCFHLCAGGTQSACVFFFWSLLLVVYSLHLNCVWYYVNTKLIIQMFWRLVFELREISVSCGNIFVQFLMRSVGFLCYCYRPMYYVSKVGFFFQTNFFVVQ